MLTMRKISVLVGDEANSGRIADYVLERAEAPRGFRSAWLGTAAGLGALGVDPGEPVRREQLAQVLQGRHATSGEQVRKPGKLRPAPGDDPVAAIATLDLTFSAPKSVSVLWSQEEPERRLAIERAMIAAAEAALTHLARSRPIVYRRLGGKRVGEPARGPAAAAALHVSARCAEGDPVPAPQLHVHGILAGVERADGELVAPNSAALFKRAAPIEGGAVARAALAERLAELGYEVLPETGPSKRYFELGGMPAELIERASARSREVRQVVEDRERERGAPLRGGALAVAALETRQAKDPLISEAEMSQAWSEWARELGFGPEQLSAMRTANGARPAADERLDAARLAFERRLAALGPTFPDDLASAIAFEAAAGRLSVDQVAGMLDSMRRDGALTELGDGRATVRPPQRLAQETLGAVTAAARGRRGPVAAESQRRGIAAASDGEAPLDQDAVATVAALCEAGWAVLRAEAPAREAILHAVTAAHRDAGRETIAVAADAGTARLLGAAIGAPWSTAQRLVHRLETGTPPLDRPVLLVIDEPEQIGLGLWAEIARIPELHDARALAALDGPGPAAIDPADAFREILRAG